MNAISPFGAAKMLGYAHAIDLWRIPEQKNRDKIGLCVFIAAKRDKSIIIAGDISINKYKRQADWPWSLAHVMQIPRNVHFLHWEQPTESKNSARIKSMEKKMPEAQ